MCSSDRFLAISNYFSSVQPQYCFSRYARNYCTTAVFTGTLRACYRGSVCDPAASSARLRPTSRVRLSTILLLPTVGNWKWDFMVDPNGTMSAPHYVQIRPSILELNPDRHSSVCVNFVKIVQRTHSADDNRMWGRMSIKSKRWSAVYGDH